MKKLLTIFLSTLIALTLITFTSCSQKLGCYYSYHKYPSPETNHDTNASTTLTDPAATELLYCRQVSE